MSPEEVPTVGYTKVGKSLPVLDGTATLARSSHSSGQRTGKKLPTDTIRGEMRKARGLSGLYLLWLCERGDGKRGEGEVDTCIGGTLGTFSTEFEFRRVTVEVQVAQSARGITVNWCSAFHRRERSPCRAISSYLKGPLRSQRKLGSPACRKIHVHRLKTGTATQHNVSPRRPQTAPTPVHDPIRKTRPEPEARGHSNWVWENRTKRK